MSEVSWWSCLRVCVFVCPYVWLSVREHSSRTTRPIFTSFVHVTYGRDSVLLWQRCETLCRLHVYPILWTTSCLHIVASNRQRQKWRTVKVFQKGTPSIPILPCCSAASFRGNPKVCKMIFCTTPKANKKLSYRRGTARCVVSIEILPIATQQCRNYLYKSWPNRWYEVGDLVWGNAW